MKKMFLAFFALVVSCFGFSVPSFAAAPDFSSVTSAVDFSTVVTGVLAVAALAAAVYVAIKGATMLIGMIRK